MLRRCGRCNQAKPTRDFAWRRKGRGQWDNYCRPCRAAYKQEHYAKNRRRYVDMAAARRRQMIDERMRFLVRYLKDHPCVDCGEKDVVVLEFDHKANKEFNVSHGIREKAWNAVLAEMEKCEVVCANCHRRRTARRWRFARAAVAEEATSRLFF